MRKVERYYHAGVEYRDGDTRWSRHTRRTHHVAAREARRMTKGGDGKPVVESWSADHGMRPGSGDAVDSCEYVT